MNIFRQHFEFVCVFVLCALSITIKVTPHTHLCTIKENNNFVFFCNNTCVHLLCIMITWSEIIIAKIMCFVDHLSLI